MPGQGVVGVVARELVVEGGEALIRLLGGGHRWLHRRYDPSSAPKRFTLQLGLGGTAQVLLQPGDAGRRKSRLRRRGGSGGDRPRLAAPRQLPTAGPAVRLAAADSPQRGR